jgi:pseudouridine synthase
MTRVRLHKAIAEAGIASRRAAEELIRQGRVSVNGEIVTGMGVQVDPEIDTVTIDGKPMSKGLKKRTYMIYKPAGVLCTRSDPQGRPTVYGLLPPEVSEGLHSAGRLDLDAEGMLILTNDGELSQALTHPSHHHHKTYLVTFKGEMDRRALRKMRNGIELDDGLTLPASVDVVRTMSTARETTVTLVLREGRKNQIKRMGDAVGHRVISIKRTATGRLVLPPKMKPGTYKRLTSKEIATLTSGRREKAGGSSRLSPKARDPRPGAERKPEVEGRRGRGEKARRDEKSPETRDPRPGTAKKPEGWAKARPKSRSQGPKANRTGGDRQRTSSRKKP